MKTETEFRKFELEAEDGSRLTASEIHIFDDSQTYSRGDRVFRLADGRELKHVGGEHFQVVETGAVLRIV